MNSPFSDKAAELAAAERVLTDNWLAKRNEAIASHIPSLEIATTALKSMGAILLDGRVSTDLRIEDSLDRRNLKPAEELGYLSLSVIPAIESLPQTIPVGLGFAWTPDVALRMVLLLKDEYKRSSGGMEPTGNVKLRLQATTWGHITAKETEAINNLGNGRNTFATYGDCGHSRNGTTVLAEREPGDTLTQEDAETILAPLASHVINYFDLTGRRYLKAHQRPGNFTTLRQA